MPKRLRCTVCTGQAGEVFKPVTSDRRAPQLQPSKFGQARQMSESVTVDSVDGKVEFTEFAHAAEVFQSGVGGNA